MQYLTRLFKLIELTRSQPQTGYSLAGIPKTELSDLASHHYMVTFVGWQLARYVNSKGAHINVERVLEFCLVHDLGELFGSDISMPYALINPKAKRLAKIFEEENQRFLAPFFGSDQKNFEELIAEVMDARSDEALIAKLADYIEVTHYKFYANVLTKDDLGLARQRMTIMLKKIKDPIAKRTLKTFMTAWLKALPKGTTLEILKG
ncbi:MAG: HD domain-containing protein [Candidatus Andersenbacteria bacterium]